MSTPSILLGPIVGGLSHDRANIWARADSPSTMHVWLAKDENLNHVKHAGEVQLPARDGCTGVVPLMGLEPDTRYSYAVSLVKEQPTSEQFHRFTTFPTDGTRRSFSFVFGSCYLPPDEYGGETMEMLQSRIEPDELRFGLFTGDQIYADRPQLNGLGRVAVTLEEYRSLYAYAWARPAIRGLLPNIPLFMILDDHEVDDDWRWNDPHRSTATIPFYHRLFRPTQQLEERQLSPERTGAALRVYYEHQAVHAPKTLIPLQPNSLGEFRFQGSDTGSFAYTFSCGAAAFFVLDLRTARIGRQTLLGEEQWACLQDWLLQVKDQYPLKFLVSSGTILHPFILDIVRDRWSGFPAERERLLKFLAVNEIEGMHILTGDLHSAHAVSAELKCPTGRRIPIWEFCSTPFEQTTMFSSVTYFPMFSKWIGKQKKYFHQTGQNFGIVHVDFDGTTPRVSFTLHYNKNGWKTRPSINT